MENGKEQNLEICTPEIHKIHANVLIMTVNTEQTISEWGVHRISPQCRGCCYWPGSPRILGDILYHVWSNKQSKTGSRALSAETPETSMQGLIWDTMAAAVMALLGHSSSSVLFLCNYVAIFCTHGTKPHRQPQVWETIPHGKDHVNIHFAAFAHLVKVLFVIWCWKRLKDLCVPFPFGN